MDKMLERFEAKYTPEPMSGCWLWIGARTQRGYSNFRLNGQGMPGHRASWLMFRGPIPEGLQIDHICQNLACVNPDHLQLATPRDNILRGNNPAALNARKTHCKNGHSLEDSENVRLQRRKDGRMRRQCRACDRTVWR